MDNRKLSSFVGGDWRTGRIEATDVNPAQPSDVVATVSLADAQVTSDAAEAAAAAFVSWQHTPAPARGEVLRKAADLLELRLDAIARDFTREEGKTIGEAHGETRRAVAILRYYAAATLDPDGEIYPSHSADTFLYARRKPIGVVAAITPWNFPMAIPAWKIAPALCYGNTVVWKPAELVPLTSVHLLQALVDAGLPEGVLNLVLGKGSEIGDVLVSHPAINAITFTGSNPVGRALQAVALAGGKKVQLEMGGKNPAVVLADADLNHAVEQVARGAFLSAGQKCSATSRVIVEASVLPDFEERLAQVAVEWKLGDPMEADTKVGPVASAAQLNTVVGYLDGGVRDGLRTLAGGTRADSLGDGYYIRPTVFADVPADNRVAREEIFGPVVALMKAKSLEEAITLANDTPFGLTASLFTRDLGKAMRFANEVEAGVVKINQETAGLEFQVPFGGTKASSSGSREQGKAAREFFTEWKTVYIDPPTPQ